MDSVRLIPSTLLVCVAHVILWFQVFVERLIADHDPHQADVRHRPLPTIYTQISIITPVCSTRLYSK